MCEQKSNFDPKLGPLTQLYAKWLSEKKWEIIRETDKIKPQDFNIKNLSFYFDEPALKQIGKSLKLSRRYIPSRP